MDAISRFFATLAQEPLDRLPLWLGIPMPESLPALFDYFGVSDMPALKKTLDDDLYPVEVPYHSPPADHIACAFNFSDTNAVSYEERSLTGRGFFAEKETSACVEDFDWPDPAHHIFPSECTDAAAIVPDDKVGVGILWSAHFQDACAAFGMEQALITMLTNPALFKAVIDRIVEFYLQANEIFYRAAANKLHAVLLGNDLGSQRGLLVSPDMLRELVFPGIKKLVDQAHGYDLKVIYHSCGSIAPIIENLINLGIDVIHPLQVSAAGMEANKIAEWYGGRVSFCGGMDVQSLMTNGTPEDIRKEVRRLRKLFPTGLILSPSHEALMPDVPPENIAAMFDEAKKKIH